MVIGMIAPASLFLQSNSDVRESAELPGAGLRTFLLTGIVSDELTLKPVGDVNIRVYGTPGGTATDPSGKFSLRLAKLPATLVVTCIGYETAAFNILGAPKETFEFFLRPKSRPGPCTRISC